MTDTSRCAPPPEYREWHWVQCGDDGKAFIARWSAAPHSGLEPLWARYGESATPVWAAAHWDWRYLAPAATPAEVAALRVEVECLCTEVDALKAERDAAQHAVDEAWLALNAQHARVAELEAENARMREALEAIAATDYLLDANEEAFSKPAARRMQEHARSTLGGTDNGR